MSKSLWSSSNEVECISPVEFSLKNLNFSLLINNPDESKKSRSGNTTNKHKEEEKTEDEKSVRMEQVPGYETPYLGMKINPSVENLKKVPGFEYSDDDDDTFAGNKVVKNTNPAYQEQAPSEIKTASLIIKPELQNPKSEVKPKIHTAHLPPALEALRSEKQSDETLSEEGMFREKARVSRPSKQPRTSNYYQKLQEYKNRSSRGKSMFNYFHKQPEEEKKEEERASQAYDKLIWGGYHKIVDNRPRDSKAGAEEADEEAVMLEGPKKVDPISYLHRGALKRKKISRLSKSYAECDWR